MYTHHPSRERPSRRASQSTSLRNYRKLPPSARDCQMRVAGWGEGMLAARLFGLSRLGIVIACLTAAVDRSAWAGDGSSPSPAGKSVLRIARQAAPRTEAEAAPADAPPQLLPPPKAAPQTAAERGVEMLPPARTEPSAANPGKALADGHEEDLDPGIRNIGSLTIAIAPPEARDDQGQPLALPPDAARDYFARQLPIIPPGIPYSPWMQDSSYGPALNFCYRPLFFEEVNLERYGHSWGVLQPAVSVAKFYGNAALVPYRVVAQHPCECTYHDHLYRPGARAPREIQVPKRPFQHLID